MGMAAQAPLTTTKALGQTHPRHLLGPIQPLPPALIVGSTDTSMAHRAYDFGYWPRCRAEDFWEHALAEQSKLKPDLVADFYQGGAFCSMEFSGETSWIIDWNKRESK